MDVQKELDRWRLDFRDAKTPEEKADHKKRFNEFLKSLSQEEGKVFTKAFIEGARTAKNELERVQEAMRLKKGMEEINEFVSMSYIAKRYFGKTRHWLYQRISGSIVNGKPAAFTPDEKKKLVDALKDLSMAINNTAHTIEQGN